jgi:hypothetical protein
VTFAPLEPYFFGGEKTNPFPGADPSQQQTGLRYYISSRDLPSQSTLFGAVRYLGLPVKRAGGHYTGTEREKMAQAIGASSFDLTAAVQTFGLIRSMSPLFLWHEERPYFPVPRNHQADKAGAPDAARYTPFTAYQTTDTNSGKKCLPLDYNAKADAPDGFVDGEGRVIARKNVVKSHARVGINRANDRDGYFKKEYKALAEGWRFAVLVEAEEELVFPASQPVFLGQGRSAFQAEAVKKTVNWKEQVKGFLARNPREIAYAASDLYVDGSLYDSCLFAASEAVDYRSFHTIPDDGGLRIDKGRRLYRFLRAGSVFIVGDREAFTAAFRPSGGSASRMSVCGLELNHTPSGGPDLYTSTCTIGLNHIVFGGQKT